MTFPNNKNRHPLFPVAFYACLAIAAMLVDPQAICGQEKGTDAEASRFAEFTKHLPVTHTEIAATNDIGRMLEQVLESEPFQETWESSSMMRAMFQGNDPKEMLDENMAAFPTALAISGNEELYGFVSDMFRLVLLTNIGIDSLEMDKFYEDEMMNLESELSGILKSFQLPEATVWVGFRDEAQTKEYFDTLSAFVQTMGMQMGIEMEESENSIWMDTKVGDLFPDQVLSAMVEGMGLADKEEVIAKSLSQFQLKLKFENLGEGIRVQLGTPSTEFGLDPTKLRGLINKDNQLAWLQWNGDQYAKRVADLTTTMDAWEKTELGQNSIKLDYQDFWNSARSLIAAGDEFNGEGHSRFWSEGEQLHGLIVQNGMAKAPTLVGDPILKWVPDGIAAYGIASDTSVADSVWTMMLQTEDRMASQSLKNDFAAPESQNPMTAVLEEAYYKEFAETRRLIRDVWTKIDASPSLLIADMSGESCRLKITETEGGSFAHRFDKFPRIAAVSRTDDSDELEKIHIAIFESIADGIFSINETSRPASWQPTKILRLDDGTQATEFDLSWVKDLASVTIRFDGDWQPHYFDLDGYFVFSTSVALSDHLLANKSSLRIPNRKGMQLVNVGKVNLRVGGEFYEQVFGMLGSLPGQSAELGAMNEIGELATEAFTNMGEFSWEAWQKDGVRERRYVIDPAARKK